MLNLAAIPASLRSQIRASGEAWAGKLAQHTVPA